MRLAHEEPPKSAARRKHNDSDYEYMYVQITQADINAGDNKLPRLQRDGWVKVDPKAEPEYDTGTEEYFAMKIPKRDLERIRKERLAPTLNNTGVEDKRFKVLEDGPDVLTPDEEAALRAMEARALES